MNEHIYLIVAPGVSDAAVTGVIKSFDYKSIGNSVYFVRTTETADFPSTVRGVVGANALVLELDRNKFNTAMIPASLTGWFGSAKAA